MNDVKYTNEPDNDGETALLYAVENASLVGIDPLLKSSKVTLNLADQTERTALDLAVRQRRFYLKTFELLEKKANPTKNLGYKVLISLWRL